MQNSCSSVKCAMIRTKVQKPYSCFCLFGFTMKITYIRRNWNFAKEVILEVISHQKWEKKFAKFVHVYISLCSQKYTRLLNIFPSFLIYSQIWLNLPQVDCQFVYKQKSLKTNTDDSSTQTTGKYFCQRKLDYCMHSRPRIIDDCICLFLIACF
jgi:hypothetical protein